jgi:hypothetical protein
MRCPIRVSLLSGALLFALGPTGYTQQLCVREAIDPVPIPRRGLSHSRNSVDHRDRALIVPIVSAACTTVLTRIRCPSEI